MTYAKKTLSEIKLIHGDFGNFIKGQKLDKKKEKKYKMPPYQDLAASTEIEGETLDEKCWPGYEKKGMKTMFGKRYPNCVKKKKTRKEDFSDWRSEINIDERKMTEKEKRKDDRLKKKYEKSDDMMKSFKDQYGEKEGEKIFYAKIRKEAMKEGVGSVVKGGLKLGSKLLKKSAPFMGGATVGGTIGYETGKEKEREKTDAMMRSAYQDQGMLLQTNSDLRKQIKDLKKKSVKEDNIQEILDKKDVPHVKKLVKKLRDGSKTHAKQADELEVALNTEDTAIESELVIQNWNVDDIKFTEIETVDIIKAKPLLDEKYQFLKKAFGKAIILGTGASKAMGKSPRLSRKASISLTTGKALKGFKDAIQKVKDLKNVQKMSDAPSKFPRDKQIIKIKKKISPNAIFPTKANVKIKNEIISDTGISTKNPIKKKFSKEHYDWREDLGEDWQKVNRNDKTDGLSKKAVKAYRRENPGSKLQTAVTKDPKKLKKGSKSAKRRLSFCRRMKGMKKKLTSAKTRRDPDSRINKALRRWNC